MTQGFSKTLSKGKNKSWPTFPLVIEAYLVEKFKQVEVESEELKGSRFVTLNHRIYDPKKVVVAHCKRANFNWSHLHSRKDHEDGVRNWYNATRELIPREKKVRDEELLEHS